VTGYEIMPRFQSMPERRISAAAVGQEARNLAFSIPLACAHLLKLNREETINALGFRYSRRRDGWRKPRTDADQ